MLIEDPTTNVLVKLFVMFASAKLLAEVFERLKQPAVVGEILAGILIGPDLLRLVEPSEITSVLAEIGVIFLLFSVGLETRPSDLLRVGRTATLVAVLGVIVVFDGESNWLEGVALIGLYGIIGATFWWG